MKRLLLCGALALAGCATPLKSTLPAASAPPSAVGAVLPNIGYDSVGAQTSALEARLQKSIEADESGLAVVVDRTQAGLVRVRFGADEAFQRGTAQLTPAGMRAASDAASAAVAVPSFVIHVLAHGADPGSELSTSLSARRAAAVASYLASLGFPAARLRSEGRDAREPAAPSAADPSNWRVELVFRPVIQGSEAEAWQAPRPDISCESCNKTS